MKKWFKFYLLQFPSILPKDPRYDKDLHWHQHWEQSLIDFAGYELANEGELYTFDGWWKGLARVAGWAETGQEGLIDAENDIPNRFELKESSNDALLEGTGWSNDGCSPGTVEIKVAGSAKTCDSRSV